MLPPLEFFSSSSISWTYFATTVLHIAPKRMYSQEVAGAKEMNGTVSSYLSAAAVYNITIYLSICIFEFVIPICNQINTWFYVTYLLVDPFLKWVKQFITTLCLTPSQNLCREQEWRASGRKALEDHTNFRPGFARLNSTLAGWTILCVISISGRSTWEEPSNWVVAQRWIYNFFLLSSLELYKPLTVYAFGI